MKLINLLGPMEPGIQIGVYIDSERDRWGWEDEDLYAGTAGATPALLTKLKVTHITIAQDPNADDHSPALVIDGIFTTEDDSIQYKLFLEKGTTK